MGLMDKVKSMFGQHSDKIDGGKHAAHVDKGQDAAKDALRKLDGEGGGGGGSH